jgi:hypothetical protein
MFKSFSNCFKLSPVTLFILLFISFCYNSKINSQTNSNPEYLSLLDSVKCFYGDTCAIGVNSKLINRLYDFQKYEPVRKYLDEYESIRKTIEDFRKTYIKTIYDEKALLLDISRIFNNARQQNIVNLSGIYLGPDSLTNISLSYIIIRTSPGKFYSKIYQVANFDQAFKIEITNYGDDWYNSKKLQEIIEFPLK